MVISDPYWTDLIISDLNLYLLRLKSIGQIHLLPLIFPPQRKWLQTWGHLNLARTLRAHEQKPHVIIFTSSSLKGAAWKIVLTLKFAQQTGHLIYGIVDGLNGICNNLLNICGIEQWNKIHGWCWNSEKPQRRGPTGEWLILHKVEHDHTHHNPRQKSSDGDQQLCRHFQLRQEPLACWSHRALLLCWRKEGRRKSYNILTSSQFMIGDYTAHNMFSLSLLQWVIWGDRDV